MKMKKTLIVLGAGASKDIHEPFPTGYELIKEINYHLTTDWICPPETDKGPYLSALMNEINKVFTYNIMSSVHVLRSKLWEVVLHYEHEYLRSLNISGPTIDHFIYEKIQNGKLDNNARNVARFAIAYLIKGLELALFEKNMPIQKENWIEELFKKLSKYPFDEVLEKLNVVTFNYDRVFEYFASEYIKKYYPGESDSRGQQFIRSKVCHVYGSLGTFTETPFELKNNETDKMKTAYTNCNLMDYSGKPIQWPAGTDFENIYFLGFGYDKENLKRINLDGFITAIKKGTGKANITNPYLIEVVPNKKCFQFCKEDINV
ncbi:MAG: hypothetical protein NT010_12430 [Proteobacteria bacterium]|nr:hypothetical protein [Pseudomonadota bacterium]